MADGYESRRRRSCVDSWNVVEEYLAIQLDVVVTYSIHSVPVRWQKASQIIAHISNQMLAEVSVLTTTKTVCDPVHALK